MRNGLLEAGKIVNTHGVRGEIKLLPWTDSPQMLEGVGLLYIDGAPVSVLASKVHKGCVIVTLEGVTDIEGAIPLINKVVSVAREDLSLEEGRHFIADLIGLRAVDAATGEEFGVVADVLKYPASDIYLVKGARETMIPAVPDFVEEINVDGGYIRFRLIEGL